MEAAYARGNDNQIPVRTISRTLLIGGGDCTGTCTGFGDGGEKSRGWLGWAGLGSGLLK
jgi:hypothetical protein